VIVRRGMEIIALVLGTAALVLIFAPELIITRLAIETTAGALLLAQLYGGALFGIAMTTWLARTMLLGGIYGGSIVVGGFAHGLVGAFALAHELRSPITNGFVWAAFIAYAVLAIWFAWLMFGSGPPALSVDRQS